MSGPADRFRGAWVEGKEWLHFCFESARGPVLANFLLESRSTGPQAVVTLLCLGEEPLAVQARTGDFDACVGGAQARIGASRVSLGRTHHTLRIETSGVVLEAELVPRSSTTMPSSTRYEDGVLHWAVTADCAVHGFLRTGGTSCALGPSAYFDHNWGAFRWGASIAWEWAWARTDQSVVVWMRMLHRTTRQELGRALLLWVGGRSVGSWVGAQLEVSHEGWWRGEPLLTSPPALAHLLPDRVTGIPGRIVLRGRSPEVEVTFEPRTVGRLVVPDDSERGVSVIHEARCGGWIARGARGRETFRESVLEVVRGG